MARRRKYHVSGSQDGVAVGPQIEHSLERAAQTAYKMADQGLKDIRVTDGLGAVIGKDVLAEAWQRRANRNLAKHRLRKAG